MEEAVPPSRAPGGVASTEHGGDELLTFFAFPPGQWKSLRTINGIERSTTCFFGE
jgi:hypothetical protein